MTTQLEMTIRLYERAGLTVPVSGDRIAVGGKEPKLSDILDWEADAWYRGVDQPEPTIRRWERGTQA